MKQKQLLTHKSRFFLQNYRFFIINSFVNSDISEIMWLCVAQLLIIFQISRSFF